MALDFDTLLTGHFGDMVIQGAIVTLELAVGSWLLAMMIAMMLVVVRLTDRPAAKLMVRAYVSYHRNIPTLIQLMMWYFALPTLLPQFVQDWVNNQNAEFIFSMVALGLCQAAYFSEDIRSGLRAVPDGQVEASRALGMSYLWSMRLVIIPQGIRNSLPNVVNHTVQLFKNTSQAMVIGVAELTYVTRDLENQTFLTFESYLIATVGYLVFSLLLMGAGAMLGNYYHRAYAR